jgi:hypothetical protein
MIDPNRACIGIIVGLWTAAGDWSCVWCLANIDHHYGVTCIAIYSLNLVVSAFDIFLFTFLYRCYLISVGSVFNGYLA